MSLINNNMGKIAQNIKKEGVTAPKNDIKNNLENMKIGDSTTFQILDDKGNAGEYTIERIGKDSYASTITMEQPETPKKDVNAHISVPEGKASFEGYKADDIPGVSFEEINEPSPNSHSKPAEKPDLYISKKIVGTNENGENITEAMFVGVIREGGSPEQTLDQLIDGKSTVINNGKVTHKKSTEFKQAYDNTINALSEQLNINKGEAEALLKQYIFYQSGMEGENPETSEDFSAFSEDVNAIQKDTPEFQYLGIKGNDYSKENHVGFGRISEGESLSIKMVYDKDGNPSFDISKISIFHAEENKEPTPPDKVGGPHEPSTGDPVFDTIEPNPTDTSRLRGWWINKDSSQHAATFLISAAEVGGSTRGTSGRGTIGSATISGVENCSVKKIYVHVDKANPEKSYTRVDYTTPDGENIQGQFDYKDSQKMFKAFGMSDNSKVFVNEKMWSSFGAAGLGRADEDKNPYNMHVDRPSYLLDKFQ